MRPAWRRTTRPRTAAPRQPRRRRPAGDPRPGAGLRRIAGQAAGTFGARVKNGVVTAQGVVSGKSRLSARRQGRAGARCRPDGQSYTLDLDSPPRRLPADGDPRPRPTTCSSPGSRWPTWRRRCARSRSPTIAVFARRPAAHRGHRHRLGRGCRCARCAGSPRPPPGSPSSRWPAGRSSLPERVPDADPQDRSRPGRRGVQPDARARGVRADPAGGQRGAAAPVRRRRQPRAAHPAGRHPRLRRAGPAPSRPGPRRRRARAGPGRVGVGPDERAGRRAPAAGPARRRPCRWPASRST